MSSRQRPNKLIPVIIAIVIVVGLLWFYLVVLRPLSGLGQKATSAIPTLHTKPLLFNRARPSGDISFRFRRCVATHHAVLAEQNSASPLFIFRGLVRPVLTAGLFFLFG
jgi:hypothetical protein